MTCEILRVDRARAWPPRPTELTRVFWDALAEGRFQTTKCADCNRFTFPPKPFCPHCWSKAHAWEALSGRGTLYSRTVIHAAPKVFADQAPIHVGIVDLEEGLRICCALVEDDGPIPLDAPVEIVVLAHTDGPLFAARART